MRRFFIFGILVAFCLLLPGFASGQDDVQKHPACKYCGMDREKFAHSRVFIDYDDGTTAGMCSLHCAAIDLALNIDKTPKTLFIGEYNAKDLIDAEKAFWIIGGKKMGVMTTKAKWAFVGKEDAEKFKAENGGDAATFDQAMKAAYEDMYADTKMIRDKRKMAKMGHKH
jgi:copper chaperone NosL